MNEEGISTVGSHRWTTDMAEWEVSGETGADNRESLDLGRVDPTTIRCKICMGG